jgi:cell division septum initiation protein DivIVA
MLRHNSSGINSNHNSSELSPHLSASEPDRLELIQQVQRLEEMIILDGMKLPLTGFKLMNDDQLLNQLTRLERSIPETVQAANKILLRQEEILTRASDYAQEIIKAAEQRAAQIADELRIVQQAEMEAEQIRKQTQQQSDAMRQKTLEEVQKIRQQLQHELDEKRRGTQAECQQIQLDADHYIDRKLSELEHQCHQVLQIVQNGRQHLHNTSTRPPKSV